MSEQQETTSALLHQLSRAGDAMDLTLKPFVDTLTQYTEDNPFDILFRTEVLPRLEAIQYFLYGSLTPNSEETEVWQSFGRENFKFILNSLRLAVDQRKLTPAALEPVLDHLFELKRKEKLIVQALETAASDLLANIAFASSDLPLDSIEEELKLLDLARIVQTLLATAVSEIKQTMAVIGGFLIGYDFLK